MLQSGSQMFRWHLARKKLEKGVGQPGCPSSPQFTKCMTQDSCFHLCLPQAPHWQHQELRDCSQAPSLPGFGSAGHCGTPGTQGHAPIPWTDLLGEPTQSPSGPFPVQGNTGYIPEQDWYQAVREEESCTLNFDFFILQRAESSR